MSFIHSASPYWRCSLALPLLISLGATGLGAATADKPAGADPGKSPSIRADDNPGVASVAEAHRTGKNPERTSALVAPAAYNHADFLRDRAAYLNRVEPGRVFQTKQGGPGVRSLDPIGSPTLTVSRGGTVTLRVQGVPDAPVSFLSTGLGAFANKLTSQTVATDAKGVASLTWTASAGTVGDVDIVVASPLCVGQARFLITVQDP